MVIGGQGKLNPKAVSSPAPKRPYSSALREEQARTTRERVVRAAGTLFAQQGYVATTRQAIAAAAAVSVVTVSSTGSKAELLLAALDQAAAGGRSLSASELDELPLTTTDDLEHLCGLVAEGAAEIYSRSARLLAVLREAAGTDAELARRHQELIQAIRQEARSFASTLHRRLPWLAEDDPLHLADTIWALTHPDLHRALLDEASWSSEQYRAWLRDMLVLVLGPRR